MSRQYFINLHPTSPLPHYRIKTLIFQYIKIANSRCDFLRKIVRFTKNIISIVYFSSFIVIIRNIRFISPELLIAFSSIVCVKEPNSSVLAADCKILKYGGFKI